MATVRVEWITSHTPTVNKHELARQQVAKQKQLDQDAADAKLKADLKEAWDAAGEKFKTDKANEIDRVLQEYKTTQEPGYTRPQLVMHPDGVERPYRRRTAADVVADLTAIQNDKGK